MEALVMFDPQNLPILSNYNDEFKSNLSELSIKLNLVENFSGDERSKIELKDHEINDLVSLIFSPFIASIRVLSGKSSFVGNLISEHVKNTRITHEEFMDHFIIFISNQKSSRNLQRDELKLNYMLEIIKFVFGSNPSSMRFNESGRDLVMKMYETWVLLRNEPRHLFEATEKLIISPQLRTNFTIVLQQVLSTIKNLSSKWNENVIHAMILLDGKLVTHFHCKCSKSSLGRKSLIMIQLLVDSLSRKTIESDEERFMSCCIDTELGSHNGNGVELKEFLIFLDPISSSSSTFKNHDCYVPVILRVVPIRYNMNLIFLSESIKQPIASNVSCLLQVFNSVLFKRSDLKGFIEVKNFNQSCIFLQKYYQVTKSKLVGLVVKKLNLITDQDFKRFLVEISHRDLPSSMDALLSSTCSSLRTLYHQEVFSSELARLSVISNSKKTAQQLNFVQKYFLSNISIFIDYIFVKSMRNMTIDPYVHVIPGIFHFVSIDRRNNLLVHSLPPNHDLTTFVVKSRQSLIMGNLYYKWTNKQRIYEYFMWFEDLKGNSCDALSNDFTLKSYPSIVGDDFIKEITSKCYGSTPRRFSNCSTRFSSQSIFEFFLVRESRSVLKCDMDDHEKVFLQVKRMSHQLREIVSPELLPNFL